MVKQIAQSSAAVLMLLATLYSGAAIAHGNVSLEADSCVRGGEGSMVHLSTYQPQFDPQAEYCTEIPQVGNTFWVIDLIDQALRNMPIDVRIVKGNSDTETETVTYMHSTNHSDGVIKGESKLDEGLYTVFITGEGVPPVQYEYPLRVQMINYADTFRTAVAPTIIILLLVFFTIKLLKSRRLQH